MAAGIMSWAGEDGQQLDNAIVQELAGHTSLAMTQRYIEGDTEAKRKLIALL